MPGSGEGQWSGQLRASVYAGQWWRTVVRTAQSLSLCRAAVKDGGQDSWDPQSVPCSGAGLWSGQLRSSVCAGQWCRTVVRTAQILSLCRAVVQDGGQDSSDPQSVQGSCAWRWSGQLRASGQDDSVKILPPPVTHSAKTLNFISMCSCEQNVN